MILKKFYLWLHIERKQGNLEISSFVRNIQITCILVYFLKNEKSEQNTVKPAQKITY